MLQENPSCIISQKTDIKETMSLQWILQKRYENGDLYVELLGQLSRKFSTIPSNLLQKVTKEKVQEILSL